MYIENMKEQLISLETAKLAKKKEFNEICQYYYEILDKPITLQKMSCSNAEGYKQPTAPTQSLLAKWLREEYNIIVLVDYEGIDWYYYKYYYYINEVQKYDASGKNYITFEEAYEIGLQEALKLIK